MYAANHSTNDSTNETLHEIPENKVSKGFQTTAYVAIFMLSIVGNSLVLIVMKKNLNSARKVVTNQLIAHLAVADLLTTICGIPIMIKRIWFGYNWLNGGVFGKILCKLDVFILETAIAVSAFTITLIALERYLVIYYPTKKFMTCEKAFRAGIIVWFGCSIFYSLNLYTMNVIVHNNIAICMAMDHQLIHPWSLIEIALFLALFSLTSIFYLAIIIKIRVYNRGQLTSPQSQLRIDVRRKMNRRVLCQSSTIVSVHYVCWMPFLFVYLSCLLSKSTISYCPNGHLIHFLMFFFGYCNAAANPIIYATLSEGFRSGFRVLLCKSLCCVKNTPQIQHGNNPCAGLIPRGGFFMTNSPEDNPQIRINKGAKCVLVEMRQLQIQSL